MSIYGICTDCGGETRDYVCDYCLLKEQEKLEAEVERLRAIVDAIEPGKQEAFVLMLFEIAHEYCGYSGFEAAPPSSAIENELKRLQAENAVLKERLQQIADGACYQPEMHAAAGLRQAEELSQE